mmetsp:Transcript_36104/g.84331  ORF Transcript_36104/g.84331 Transcript_36104/m.84331 type:complete len:232 (-) Transcript_36104:2919-3614(-)
MIIKYLLERFYVQYVIKHDGFDPRRQETDQIHQCRGLLRHFCIVVSCKDQRLNKQTAVQHPPKIPHECSSKGAVDKQQGPVTVFVFFIQRTLFVVGKFHDLAHVMKLLKLALGHGQRSKLKGGSRTQLGERAHLALQHRGGQKPMQDRLHAFGQKDALLGDELRTAIAGVETRGVLNDPVAEGILFDEKVEGGAYEGLAFVEFTDGMGLNGAVVVGIVRGQVPGGWLLHFP